MAQAVSEMSHYGEFNYIVINDQFDLAHVIYKKHRSQRLSISGCVTTKRFNQGLIENA